MSTINKALSNSKAVGMKNSKFLVNTKTYIRFNIAETKQSINKPCSLQTIHLRKSNTELASKSESEKG